MISREHLIDALSRSLPQSLEVKAAWLAGSQATGRLDEWSDIDLMLLVEDDAVDVAIKLVEATLTTLSTIALRYRVPEPAWHDHSQVFYQLTDAPQWLMVDVLLMKRTTSNWFLEPERHGTPTVLFDREGLVKPATLDRAVHQRQIDAKLADLRVKFVMFQHLIRKSIRRRNPAEAVAFYHALTLRPLVELLRIRHCPERFDYGLRYLHDDLPPSMAERVNDLSLIVDLEDLERKHAACLAWFDETLDALETGSPATPIG